MIKAGLDIGNSKISCVIADYKNIDNINTRYLVKRFLLDFALVLVCIPNYLFNND